MAAVRTCTIEGCDNPYRAKGRCNKHYHELKNARKAKPCACGCGELTPHRFKWGHHTRLFTSEEQQRRGLQNTGDKLRRTGSGYVKLMGQHEHRVVVEHALKRKLLPDEIVHHRNGNKQDNRLENLQIVSRAEHIEIHRQDLVAGQRQCR